MNIPSVNAASTYDNILTLLARLDFVMDAADCTWLKGRLEEQITRLEQNTACWHITRDVPCTCEQDTRLDIALGEVVVAIVKALDLRLAE